MSSSLRAGLEGGFVIPEGGIGFAEIIAEKPKPARGAKKGAVVERLRFFQEAVRFDQVRLGGGAIARLVVELAELLQAEGVVAVAGLESALRQIERGLGDADCLRQPIAGPQHVQLVVEDAPQLFVALHSTLPTLTQLADKVLAPVLRRPGATPAVRPCSHPSPTKKLVDPAASDGPASVLPSRPTSV